MIYFAVFSLVLLSGFVYLSRQTGIRVKKIISEDLGDKKLFIVRINSNDFLFEDVEGKVSLLTEINEQPMMRDFAVNHNLEEKVLHLLELENAGHS